MPHRVVARVIVSLADKELISPDWETLERAEEVRSLDAGSVNEYLRELFWEERVLDPAVLTAYEAVKLGEVGVKRALVAREAREVIRILRRWIDRAFE